MREISQSFHFAIVRIETNGQAEVVKVGTGVASHPNVGQPRSTPQYCEAVRLTIGLTLSAKRTLQMRGQTSLRLLLRL